MYTIDEVYNILKNNNNVQEVGTHEYDNSWLISSIEELTNKLNEKEYRLIGWFPLSAPKKYADNIYLDIGIVAEEEDGYRFWCHYIKRWLEDDIEEYEEKHSVKE